jgi:uncharacterized protein YjbJ (UPF0337 family)
MEDPSMREFEEEKVQGKTEKEEGLWKQFRGRIQEAWGSLSDDDIHRLKGRRDQIIGQIQEKTGEARAAIAEKLDEIADEVNYRLRSSKDEGKRGGQG